MLNFVGAMEGANPTNIALWIHYFIGSHPCSHPHGRISTCWKIIHGLCFNILFTAAPEVELYSTKVVKFVANLPSNISRDGEVSYIWVENWMKNAYLTLGPHSGPSAVSGWQAYVLTGCSRFVWGDYDCTIPCKDTNKYYYKKPRPFNRSFLVHILQLLKW